MDYENTMATRYEREIPDGYEARIEGNKVIFELKEGEDELIRRRLINLIKELAAAKLPIATGGYFVDGQDKKYIAYLEKQKDAIGAARQQGYEEGMEDGASMVDQKQKEQQPAEWSEEDEDMYARIVRRYTDYEGVIMRTKEESVAAKMLDAMAQEENWLHKSLRPQPHWKPSEKEIEALSWAINYLTDIEPGRASTLALLKFDLKSL